MSVGLSTVNIEIAAQGYWVFLLRHLYAIS